MPSSATPTPQSQLPTDEARIERLANALTSLWAMVQRGVYPHRALNRFFPTRVLAALPPTTRQDRDVSTEASRVRAVAVSVHTPTRAWASAVVVHPAGRTEAVSLDFHRADGTSPWELRSFVPIRHRHLELAHAVASPPENEPARAREDLRALVGDFPKSDSQRTHYYKVIDTITRYAVIHDIDDLCADLAITRGSTAHAQHRDRVLGVIEDYRDRYGVITRALDTPAIADLPHGR